MDPFIIVHKYIALYYYLLIRSLSLLNDLLRFEWGIRVSEPPSALWWKTSHWLLVRNIDIHQLLAVLIK